MKWIVIAAVCYALLGVLTVACAGYREGFQRLYGSDMLTQADMVGIFGAWPVVWIGFGFIMLYTAVVTALGKVVRRPAQKIGEAHKVEWDARRSAIRELDRLLDGGK